MNVYDVIIAGAGPGGSTAAYFLGEANLNVLVLEKEKLPRYKTCGGALPANIFELFPFSFDPVIESHVEAVSFAFKERMVTIPTPASPVRMVMRKDFDAYLLAHTNVEVRSEKTVRRVTEEDDHVLVETRDGEVFAGRYLIGADGANSSVSAALDFPRKKRLVAAIEFEVEVPPEVMRPFSYTPLFIFGDVRMGYAWVFPKADHLSVGIAALHPKPGELRTTLARVMLRYGISLEHAIQHGHPIPLYSGRQPIATRRVLLVGDAAGLVDPFSGEGIRYAVKSGKLAAEAILSGHTERYAGWVQRQIGVGHTFASALAWLFYHFPGACFMLGVYNPFASYAFVSLAANRATYTQVILVIFTTLPLFLMTEGVSWLASRLGSPDYGDCIRSWIYPALPDLN